MTIGDRNPRACRADLDGIIINDLVTFDLTKHLEGLFLALLLLAGDERHDVVDEVEGCDPWISSTRGGLARRDDATVDLEPRLVKRVYGRKIALHGAVWLHDDEAFFPTMVFLLGRDDFQVIVINLLDQHGHVGRPPVNRSE